jgi:hypothetical protein
MKRVLILVAIFLVLLVYFSVHSPSPTVVSNPVAPDVSNSVATDDRESKAILYMSCLGFSTSQADGAWKATHGDMNKFLTMTHLAVTGELTEDTPLTQREKTCRKGSGL